jgi:hypothetical protein
VALVVRRSQSPARQSQECHTDCKDGFRQRQGAPFTGTPKENPNAAARAANSAKMNTQRGGTLASAKWQRKHGYTLPKLLRVRCLRPIERSACNDGSLILSHEVKTDRMPDVQPFSGKDSQLHGIVEYRRIHVECACVCLFSRKPFTQPPAVIYQRSVGRI